MPNIWVSTDLHLWNNYTKNHSRPFRSEREFKELRDAYAEIGESDIWIFLGDLCDEPSSHREELGDFIRGIGGHRILVKGNHDVQTDEFYHSIGFEYVCDICEYHDLVFSHQRLRVSPNYINIHGDDHLEKHRLNDGCHINVYAEDLVGKPIMLDELLDLSGAISQDLDAKDHQMTNAKGWSYPDPSVLNRADGKPIVLDLCLLIKPYPMDESVDECDSEDDYEDRILDEILFQDVEQTKDFETDDHKDEKKPHRIHGKNDVVAERPTSMDDGEVCVDESIDGLADIFNEAFGHLTQYYRVAPGNMDGETVHPSIPQNYFTKHGYEDNETPRVCFSTSIGGCLTALSRNLTDEILYVHVPEELPPGCTIYHPTTAQVPDCKLTGEVWLDKPCKLSCIGKIKCHPTRGVGKKFRYGDGQIATLYSWMFEWLERYEQKKKKPTNESVELIDKAARTRSLWRDKLFGGRLFGRLASNLFVKVTIEDGHIEIRGINCNLLLQRIKEKYAEGKLRYIFECKYNEKSWKAFQAKKISRGQMKIDYVYAPEFFCLEFVTLFRELGEAYGDRSYLHIAELIYENSWLSHADEIRVDDLNLEPLGSIRLELLDHQVEFIRQWNQLKAQLNLNGYVLAFQPGKGKTLTAVGLAQCLHAKRIYIVCPNNLKDNWALELRKYFQRYQNMRTWMDEVCILGTPNAKPKTARWIITNNENIKLMQAIAENDPDAMLILDESHNFRNYTGGRAQELFKLADTIGSHNVLCISATPIKAAPAEITPVLRLIDPTFTDEAASMYSRCFSLNETEAMSLVATRFGKVIYRPLDVNVQLPPKNEHVLEFPAAQESRYYLSTVHDEIIADFKTRHGQWVKESRDDMEWFQQTVKTYSDTDRRTTNGYLGWVIWSSNSLRNGGGEDYHELTVEEYMHFLDDHVLNNKWCIGEDRNRLIELELAFRKAAKVSMGKAIGSILPPRRNELYTKLFRENTDQIAEMIRNRTKKTIIFSTMVPVVNAIAAGLNGLGIGTVKITGETKDRLSTLTKFKEDPNTLVMVATSQSLGVGVTLTEASQLFYFGTPWRSTDYEQASDRIWRIGQTDAVDIYTVKMKSKEKNLSDRMQDILDWSARMFGVAVDGQEQQELVEAVNYVRYVDPHVWEPTEEYLSEAMVRNLPDIYYNKDAFDKGEINLCFITGHSGSGKSTMGKSMESNDKSKKTDWINMDDCQVVAEKFTMDNLREYSGLIYGFFAGPGKDFYIDNSDEQYAELCRRQHIGNEEGTYEKALFTRFVDYAITYANSHKDRRFVLEGIWMFLFIEPGKLKDYAVYIKGTSALLSKWRANRRDIANDVRSEKGAVNKVKRLAKDIVMANRRSSYLSYKDFDKKITAWQNYYGSLATKQLNEETIEIPADTPVHILDMNDFHRIARDYDARVRPIIQGDPIVNESVKDDVRDIKTIISNLSKEESDHVGGGYWVESDHVIYRKIERIDSNPVAFIDVYLLPKFPRKGLVVLAVSKDARGKGIGKKLVAGAISALKSSKDIDALRWLADNDNEASLKMAVACGFVKTKVMKSETEFIYQLHEPMSEDAADLRGYTREEQEDYAKKHGIKSPGHDVEADKKIKEYEDPEDKQRKRYQQQLDSLKKARRVKKHKRRVRKVKEFFGVKPKDRQKDATQNKNEDVTMTVPGNRGENNYFDKALANEAAVALPVNIKFSATPAADTTLTYGFVLLTREYIGYSSTCQLSNGFIISAKDGSIARQLYDIRPDGNKWFTIHMVLLTTDELRCLRDRLEDCLSQKVKLSVNEKLLDNAVDEADDDGIDFVKGFIRALIGVNCEAIPVFGGRGNTTNVYSPLHMSSRAILRLARLARSNMEARENGNCMNAALNPFDPYQDDTLLYKARVCSDDEWDRYTENLVSLKLRFRNGRTVVTRHEYLVLFRRNALLRTCCDRALDAEDLARIRDVVEHYGYFTNVLNLYFSPNFGGIPQFEDNIVAADMAKLVVTANEAFAGYHRKLVERGETIKEHGDDPWVLRSKNLVQPSGELTLLDVVL